MDKLLRGLNVISISVPDLAAAKAFYADTLGLGPPIYDLPDAGWIEFQTGRAGSGNIALVLADVDWRPSTGTTIVFDVADCHAAVETLRQRGVSCEDAQTFPGFVVFASLSDPFGNRLQICSPAPDQS